MIGIVNVIGNFSAAQVQAIRDQIRTEDDFAYQIYVQPVLAALFQQSWGSSMLDIMKSLDSHFQQLVDFTGKVPVGMSTWSMKVHESHTLSVTATGGLLQGLQLRLAGRPVSIFDSTVVAHSFLLAKRCGKLDDLLQGNLIECQQAGHPAPPDFPAKLLLPLLDVLQAGSDHGSGGDSDHGSGGGGGGDDHGSGDDDQPPGPPCPAAPSAAAAVGAPLSSNTSSERTQSADRERTQSADRSGNGASSSNDGSQPGETAEQQPGEQPFGLQALLRESEHQSAWPWADDDDLALALADLGRGTSPLGSHPGSPGPLSFFHDIEDIISPNHAPSALDFEMPLHQPPPQQQPPPPQQQQQQPPPPQQQQQPVPPVPPQVLQQLLNVPVIQHVQHVLQGALQHMLLTLPPELRSVATGMVMQAILHPLHAAPLPAAPPHPQQQQQQQQLPPPQQVLGGLAALPPQPGAAPQPQPVQPDAALQQLQPEEQQQQQQQQQQPDAAPQSFSKAVPYSRFCK